MDHAKCKTLKAELAAQPEPQIVSAERFFDGNDDPGSIGCNLLEHPGVGAFRDVILGLLRRSDVQAVYAQIAELDPGEGCWPFTDTILVVGAISPDELRSVVGDLEPDDVAAADDIDIALLSAKKQGSPVLAIWWD